MKQFHTWLLTIAMTIDIIGVTRLAIKTTAYLYSVQFPDYKVQIIRSTIYDIYKAFAIKLGLVYSLNLRCTTVGAWFYKKFVNVLQHKEEFLSLAFFFAPKIQTVFSGSERRGKVAACSPERTLATSAS